MLRKLMLPLLAALVLAGCGVGPSEMVMEDPDGDPIEFDETGARIYR